jgi:hypothetical protein
MMKRVTAADVESTGSVLAGFITPTELCKELRRTRRTLDRWHSLGLGPPRLRVQRMILYKVEDVRAWLTAHEERHEFKTTRSRIPVKT